MGMIVGSGTGGSGRASPNPEFRVGRCHDQLLVVLVGHALADPATRARHEVLHALVTPQHVEDAGRKPQQEEEQKQPGLGAEPRSNAQPIPPPTTTAATISAAMRMPWAMPRPRISASRSACALASRCALILSSLSPRSWKPSLAAQPPPRGSSGARQDLDDRLRISHEDHALGERRPDTPGAIKSRPPLKAAGLRSVKNAATARGAHPPPGRCLAR